MALETAGPNGATGTNSSTGRQDSRPPSPLLEAVLSLELSHPNIIKTYKYETRTVQVGLVCTHCPVGLKSIMDGSGGGVVVVTADQLTRWPLAYFAARLGPALEI